MSFIGKICPYCKSEFKEEDEVVICSICETPHHKKCWIENNGCTSCGCTGTIMDTENYNSYNEVQIDEDIQMFDEDMQTFIGVNQDYYVQKFQELNIKSSKASWNWASAILGSYWYAYRKMYLIQFLYYISALFIIALFGSLVFGGSTSRNNLTPILAFIPLLILILPCVLSGIIGNYLYKYHVEKHVKIAKNMDNYTKQNYLVKKGGTSGCAVLVLILISLILKII